MGMEMLVRPQQVTPRVESLQKLTEQGCATVVLPPQGREQDEKGQRGTRLRKSVPTAITPLGEGAGNPRAVAPCRADAFCFTVKPPSPVHTR